MPFTPPALRPIGRTSVSRKRIAWPSWLARKIIFLPSVSLAPMSSSLASRLIAMMPLARGLENSVSADFFTVPLRVARNTNLLWSWRLRAATSAVSFSSSWKRTRVAIDVHRGALDVAGVAHGDGHIGVRDEVFELDLLHFVHDLRAAVVAIIF